MTNSTSPTSQNRDPGSRCERCRRCAGCHAETGGCPVPNTTCVIGREDCGMPAEPQDRLDCNESGSQAHSRHSFRRYPTALDRDLVLSAAHTPTTLAAWHCARQAQHPGGPMIAEDHCTEAERLLIAASDGTILAAQAQVLATRAAAHAQLAAAYFTGRAVPRTNERAQAAGGHR